MSFSINVTGADQYTEAFSVGDKANLYATTDGSWSGTLVLQRRLSPTDAWATVDSYNTQSGSWQKTINNGGKPAEYRLGCSSYSAGGAVCVLS